jgi:tripeptide aminopeptidase
MNTHAIPAAAPAQPNLERAFDLVMQLMAISGRSGEERAVAEFVATQLRRADVADSALETDSAHQRTPVPGQTGNLIFKLPGTLRRPRRLLSAHLDTVPICVGSRPVREGNFVRSAVEGTGLGADDRAGAAVVLNTALEILENGLPHPPLTFCWFVQEETGLHGARCVSKGLLARPRMAFNWDGGMAAKVTVGATGGYRMQIAIRGLASHAGTAPELGVSAITIAALAIADLHRRGWLGLVRKGRQRGTSNVGVIQGGEATNVVTDRVLVRAEARSHDPDFRRKVITAIEQAFTHAAAAVKNAVGAAGRVEIEGRLDYESYRLADDEPCVQSAAEAVRSVGREPEFAVSNGGLDANWLVKHGIPTVSLGCGQLNPHTTSEALDVTDFEHACRIALRLATG